MTLLCLLLCWKACEYWMRLLCFNCGNLFGLCFCSSCFFYKAGELAHGQLALLASYDILEGALRLSLPSGPQ